VSATWRRVALVTVKLVHTAAFFSIGSCLVYLAYSGLTRRSDRRAAIAGVVVTGEALVYAANGFRCPLTEVAERLGSKAIKAIPDCVASAPAEHALNEAVGEPVDETGRP
jgi:hypothetical protein